MEPYASPVPIPDFAPGGDFSVGVEEELMLLEPGGDLMGDAAAPLVSALRADPGCRGVVTAEVYVDQVELNSPVCAGAEDAHASLRALRSWVLGQGAVPAAVGVHPAAPLGGACLSPSPRYDAIVAEYGGLLRTPTAALQVHVGVPDAATAMLAYRGLRQQMPLLRALAAATPYWHGVDSGLASTRSAILRSYPRTTVPPLLRSWDEYVDRTRALVRAAEVPDHTYVWWDLRPRPELGTLEVRVMDAQPSLARVAGLTALVQGIARHAVEAPARDELSDDVLAVNDHRAAHGGLGPRVVDGDGVPRPMREVAHRVLAQARAVLAGDGLAAPLDVVEEMLAGPDEPTRQRRMHEAAGMRGLLADLVARTADLDG